ncbi:MAG: hypothetical protein IVW57_12125 [Ktedonobacterales bacterium]|nr:hypothetical protein [Ktedonobacterales bacterium]
MADDWVSPGGEQGKDRPEARDEAQPTEHDERERQARETVRIFRESTGDLGARVRQVITYASTLWAQASPAAEIGGRDPSGVPPADEMRARALARRWITLDFLVDPEVPLAMGVTTLRQAAVWHVELRERGETRSLVDVTEPYRGGQPGAPGPILPVWDYAFPTVPDIESGERRERLPQSDVLAVCEKCNGSGHQACAACEGNGLVPCAKCHGRTRLSCRRCRGRGAIADPAAERQARAGKSYLQVHAERLANDAAGRLADFAERLRQEHGVPLPPSAQWAPIAPASGVTMPCPSCVDGAVPCNCANGKAVCDVCLGSGHAECPTCGATGRVMRHREVVRRFDTRITERTLPLDPPELADWLAHRSLQRTTGETIWEGPTERVALTPPAGVPEMVWSAARELTQTQARMWPGEQNAPRRERRVLSGVVRLMRVPITHVSYTFAGQPFEFVAIGQAGAERFSAQGFPARLTHVARFLQAVAHDLASERLERPSANNESGEVRTLAEYRSRRMRHQPHRVRIFAEDEATQAGEIGPGAEAAPDTPASTD